MGILIYATPDDLESWTGATQDDSAKPLLREASILVRKATRNDIYDTAPSGLPSDDDLVGALRDATCAQAETWSAAGYDVIAGPGGQEPRLTVSGIDGAQVSFDAYLTNAARDTAMTSLCQSSYEILRDAGLATAVVL